MKGFFKTVIYGAGMYLGWRLANEVVDTVKDPYKKTKIKNKFSKIKNTIFEKSES